jgi:hypothetical protein
MKDRNGNMEQKGKVTSRLGINELLKQKFLSKLS